MTRQRLRLFSRINSGVQFERCSLHAQVAELVDALASGASDHLVVEVRVFSWAPQVCAVTKNDYGSFFLRNAQVELRSDHGGII